MQIAQEKSKYDVDIKPKVKLTKNTNLPHLTNLINQLTLDIKNNNTHNIKHPQKLLLSLNKLYNIIGMNKLKEDIAKQTSYLIQKMRSGDFKLSMLNTTLAGFAGTGKTTIGIILSNIWHDLGFLQLAANQNRSYIDYFNQFSTTNMELLQVYVIFFTLFLIKLYDYIIKPIYDNYGLYMLLLLFLIIFVIISLTFKIYDNEFFINDDEKPIVITSRSTFVSEYLGGSFSKTEKFLQNNLGKVIFIDEAYSLYNGYQDSYGLEVINCLNKFMSEHENEIVIVLAGYEKELQESIFKAQPGLARRIIWTFKFDNYNGEELFDIFKLKLNEEKKQIYTKDEYKIKKCIIKNENEFTGNGGDINKLLFYIMLNKNNNTNYITYQDVKNGIQELINNHINKQNDKVDNNLLNDFKKYFDN